MFWGILIAIGVVLLVLGGLVSGVGYVLFAPDKEPNTAAQNATIVALGAVAFVAMMVIGSLAPDAWWVPLILWVVALAVVNHSSPLKETPEQQRAREEAERKQAEQDERRAAARKVVAERKRVDSYTKGGLTSGPSRSSSTSSTKKPCARSRVAAATRCTTRSSGCDGRFRSDRLSLRGGQQSRRRN